MTLNHVTLAFPHFSKILVGRASMEDKPEFSKLLVRRCEMREGVFFNGFGRQCGYILHRYVLTSGGIRSGTYDVGELYEKKPPCWMYAKRH